jgi:uncharacterized membrane protein YphA (DoxX/SURF4 family)
MYSPLPIAVLYAGLAGMLLALLIATAQNRWSLRVFFFLALRLAIGWHFLFEGLYKVNSRFTGPTDANPRTFSSEPYFRTAPGPIAAHMRRQYDDPLATITEKVKAPKPITRDEFLRLTPDQQAEECPPSVAKQLDELAEKANETVAAMKAEGEKELAAVDPALDKDLKAIDASEAEDLKKAQTALEKKQAKEKADEARQEARSKAADKRRQAQAKVKQFDSGQSMLIAAKATYARWVYGVDGLDTTLKGINDPVSLTGPERLEHLEWLRKKVKEAEDRHAAGLGNGYGTEVKRAAEVRTDLIVAESELARDANRFVADLKKALNGGKPVEEKQESRLGDTMDVVTMWFLVVVGACLMAGLFTRVACVLGAGFLVMTYLAYPPFPWYPVAPNTEGNPLFINKNVIECIALLALACMPTGRWMGLDAIVLRPFCRYKGEGN